MCIIDRIHFACAMILTLVCLTDKLMKTEWDVVGGGGPPSKGLEDVIPENRLVHRINMPGRKEVAASPSPTLGPNPKLGHKPLEPVPRRFYMQIKNEEDTAFLVVPRASQQVLRGWFHIRLPRGVLLAHITTVPEVEKCSSTVLKYENA